MPVTAPPWPLGFALPVPHLTRRSIAAACYGCVAVRQVLDCNGNTSETLLKQVGAGVCWACVAAAWHESVTSANPHDGANSYAGIKVSNTLCVAANPPPLPTGIRRHYHTSRLPPSRIPGVCWV